MYDCARQGVTLLVQIMIAFVFIVTPKTAFALIEQQQQRRPAQHLNTTDNNTSLNAIPTTTSNVIAITHTIELGEPFAV
jgi:hypothetical protein